jgi:hypothetical protein
MDGATIFVTHRYVNVSERPNTISVKFLIDLQCLMIY